MMTTLQNINPNLNAMKSNPFPYGTIPRFASRMTWLRVLALMAVACAVPASAQTWFSLQEADVRIGDDSATVNASGTQVTTSYITHFTYLRGYVDKTNNFNTDTNLLMGTANTGTSTDFDSLRLLAGFDLTPVANHVAGQAYTVDAVRLIMTHRTIGVGGNSTMAMHSTTPFDEATATWNEPGGGAPVGGAIGTQLGTKGIAGNGASYPSNQTWTATGLTTAIQSAIANPGDKWTYLLFKRGTESDANYFSRYVTDENTDETYGGIDGRPELQVAVTILSNAPLVSVTATDAEAAEGTTNKGLFTITRTVDLSGELPIYFNMSGLAALAADYELDPPYQGYVVLPAGVATTNIVLIPLDDSEVEADEATILTIVTDPGNLGSYGIGVASATVTIADDNDAHALVQYLFTTTYAPKLWTAYLTATSVAGGGGVIPNFSAANYVSAPASMFVGGNQTSTNETQAVAENDFVSFTLNPQPGARLALTNLQLSAYYNVINSLDAFAQYGTVFVRSSVDDYTATLGSVTVQGDNYGGGWETLSIPLGTAFNNLVSPATFRVYFYDDMSAAGTSGGLRLDNLFVRGTIELLPFITHIGVSGSTVTIAFTDESRNQPSGFTLQRSSTATGPYTDDLSANITGSSGTFQAVTTVNGNTQFYRLHRN